jgi:hypothetical protein
MADIEKRLVELHAQAPNAPAAATVTQAAPTRPTAPEGVNK